MFLQFCYIEKISPCFCYEGFRTPSVHRGRSLPSCTATSVLLSGSGPECKSRGLLFYTSKTCKCFIKEVKKNPLTFLFSKCILTVSSQIVQLVQMVQFLGKGGDDMIEINPTSSQPIFEQIIAQIKMAVLKGLLKPGDSVPSGFGRWHFRCL